MYCVLTCLLLSRCAGKRLPQEMDATFMVLGPSVNWCRGGRCVYFFSKCKDEVVFVFSFGSRSK